MQKWIDVIRLANNGNLNPDQRIEKSEEEWKSLLTEEQFYVTRKKGTERAHSSEMCNLFEPGKYACVCCNTVLFDSEEKFQRVIPPKRAASKSRINTSPAFSAGRVSLLKPSYAFALE